MGICEPFRTGTDDTFALARDAHSSDRYDKGRALSPVNYQLT